MPSPFPGMDPWIEDPGGWRDVHNRLIAYMSDDLNRSLGSQYLARVTERVIVEAPLERPRRIEPDVSVVPRRRNGARGSTALADAPLVIQVEPTESREWGVEIRDRKGRKLITVIEVLSPTNKDERGSGRADYQRKQREVLESDVNLVEIDLLRAGMWTVAVPEDYARDAAAFHYIVSMSRAVDRRKFEVHPILLGDRLPRVAIPLRGGDPDVSVDLQALFEQCYDNGQYGSEIDYGKPPNPPLTRAQATWARRILRRPRRRR